MKDEKTVMTAEAARMLNVCDMTVVRWANAGIIPHTRTAGGHRRFRIADIKRIKENK